MSKHLPLLAALTFASLTLPVVRAEPAETPVELGAVSWLRDFDAASKEAREQEQALLVLFQEVPG